MAQQAKNSAKKTKAKRLAKKNAKPKSLKEKRKYPSRGGFRKGSGRKSVWAGFVTEHNRQVVREMCQAGFNREDICLMFRNPETQDPISEDALLKYFRVELETAKNDVVRRIAAKLVRKADGGNLSAQIFFLKTQGRFRETMQTTTPPGEPVTTKIELDEAARAALTDAILKSV